MIDVHSANAMKDKFARVANASNNLQILKKNSTDATQIRAKPLLVLWPANKQQVLGIIKIANQLSIPVVPRGGGSGLCGGAVADNAVVINLTKMKKIIKLDKKHRWIIVQPGIFLDVLNNHLARYGLSFPVKTASHKIATVGGMVSTNASGEHALRFGKMSDNILELEVVTGSGKLVKVNKSRIRHFCGTEGLMGIVVAAKLRLVPKIRRTSLTVHETDTHDNLLKIVRRSVKNKNLIACEFINPMLFSMQGFRNKYFLLLEYAGTQGNITNKRQIKKYWNIREKCFDILFKRGWKFIADPELPARSLAGFLKWCERNKLPAFGHIGHGIIHVHFRNTKMDELYKLVKKLHGAASGEHGFGILKKKYLSYERKTELRRLKRIYDRNNIMNRGKII